MSDPSAPEPVRPAGATSSVEQDWTDQVTDLIVDTVDKVRNRTTGPILEGAKGLVYAIVAMIVLVPILIMGTAGTIRFLNWLLPGDVWVAYAVLGAVLVLVGALLWSKRAPRVR